MAGPIDDYMTQLERELRRRGIDDPRMLAEVREHLVDAIDAGRQRGLSAADAEREALERFGAPRIVAAHMLEERSRTAGRFETALGIAWQRKWWIAVPTVCAAIVAAVLSQFVMPPRYRAESRILVTYMAAAGATTAPAGADFDEKARLRRIDDHFSPVIRRVVTRPNLESLIREFALYDKEQRIEDRMHRMIWDLRFDPVTPVGIAQTFSVSFVYSDPRIATAVSGRLAEIAVRENLAMQTSPFERRSVRQVRILDGTRASERPIGLTRSRVTLLGTLVGLLFGLMLALLRPSGATPPPPTLAEA
jgi:hypothetical protein